MNDAMTQALVEVSKEIEASPDTVWGILSSPERFSMWMDGQVEFETTVGSPFRAAFPNFQTVVSGEVVTFDPEARHLGLTWGVEEGPQAEGFPAGCSVVDFFVHPSRSGCRVDIRHSEIPTTTAAEEHAGGWQFHLSRMALFANRSDLGTGLQRTLAGWFSAWNDQDDESRLATLRSCCAEDVEFQDDWTSHSGVELLNLHISNCFKFMPGWRLDNTGDVTICRGEALVGWRSVGPGGAPMEGFNHVRADPDGTIRRVAGFQRT